MTNPPRGPWHPDTRAIRTRTQPSPHQEHASSIYMTSSFLFDDAEHARSLFAKEAEGSIYSRYSNPSVDEFIAKMCFFEEMEEGIAVASGMSAVYTGLAGLLNSGDHIVSSRSVFGSTHRILNEILPRWNITSSLADIGDLESWESCIRPNTKLLYVETPSNPALDLADLEALGALCRAHDIIFYVDNIFATPILQSPSRFGADIIMHSATKYIDGQGRGLGGVILGKPEFMEPIRTFARHTGPCLSPFNAWMFSKSLETLGIRMERHCHNALALARFLEGHNEVERVKYPYLPSHPQFQLAQKQMRAGGGMVSFEARGGLAGARSFIDKLKLCSLSSNLGDTRTIVTHPASTTHSGLTEEERQSVGIQPGLVRVSVGLEYIDDLIADFAQALE